ncbi:RNA polymerase sigma-70 factor (ECF subfamily) [Cricetibacter osteomyelitidis]|uniref:RNA polymerase sigma-70 factor (ECF subfamily) n=1 Tax=Cricetibacter osteomyelitidis TaxID=1521931 RepID=A0A4R2SPX1_9PAST|nr:sigma-70 family RNA polymerase sigma factor [Cricetibacter osteomyelitidis]TCP92227.1 RNA polymerase sigma-70 factor (ECF subfamily) [Cricetibacter osteomyelitidis]
MIEKGSKQFISPEQIAEIREQMLKFAYLQLQDNPLAEDIVQEAFFYALKNIGSFQRQAALKTWIFAILKNKIIDYFRQKGRFVLESEIVDEQTDSGNHFFDEQGHWKEEYYTDCRQESESAVYSEEFWLLFETCLTRLPALQSRVFMMREYFECSTNEICEQVEISSSNLHVLLYRARLQLQHCLAKKLM